MHNILTKIINLKFFKKFDFETILLMLKANKDFEMV